MFSYPDIPSRVLERWSKMLGNLTELLSIEASDILQFGDGNGFEIVAQQRRPKAQCSIDPVSLHHEIHRQLGEKVGCDRRGFVIDAASAEPRWRQLQESMGNILAYLGFPIAWPDGTNFGIIEVLDDEPRIFSPVQRELVEQFRDSIEDQLARIVADARLSAPGRHTGVERERLALAAAASGAGIWDYNIDADVLHCDARWHQILGLDPADPVESIEAFKPHIHPDDVARATEVQATMAELIANRRDYNITFRIIRPNGEVRWLKSVACLVVADGSSPNRAVGAIADITEQTLATAALAESELRFKTLAEMLPQGIFSAQPDGSIDYHNGRWCEVVGVAEQGADSVLWSTLLHPDDLERATQAWKRSLGAAERYEVEARCRRKSGEYRWLHVTAVPVMDHEGRVTRWFGMVADIHDAKLMELNREALAQELDHRIRNLFAIVDGLISLCVRDDPDMARFAAKLRQRLTALHRAHSLAVLPGSSIAVSLHDLIQMLLEPYRSGVESRVLVDGEDIRIEQKATTPLALIFHELATNAGKYGALGAPNGRLHVTIARDGERLQVSWVEIGTSGDDGAAERKGFGSKLLSLLIDVQLGGQFSTRWTPRGLTIELRLPLSAVEMPAEGG